MFFSVCKEFIYEIVQILIDGDLESPEVYRLREFYQIRPRDKNIWQSNYCWEHPDDKNIILDSAFNNHFMKHFIGFLYEGFEKFDGETYLNIYQMIFKHLRLDAYVIIIIIIIFFNLICLFVLFFSFYGRHVDLFFHLLMSQQENLVKKYIKLVSPRHFILIYSIGISVLTWSGKKYQNILRIFKKHILENEKFETCLKIMKHYKNIRCKEFKMVFDPEWFDPEWYQNHHPRWGYFTQRPSDVVIKNIKQAEVDMDRFLENFVTDEKLNFSQENVRLQQQRMVRFRKFDFEILGHLLPHYWQKILPDVEYIGVVE